MSETTVALRGVTKRYGNQTAVADVDVSFNAGECIALVGHNGAGKSTLIKLMLGLIRASSGKVEVLGQDAGKPQATATRADLGYLPENVVFPPAMTGRELLGFYARLKRRDVAANEGLLERVGLVHAAERRIGTYSKGMRQRLGLAQALIGSPRLMLLDEPTTGLDPALRRTFYGIIDELAGDGVTVLLSSHALMELEPRSDRIIVMNRGRKVADGTMADLRALAHCPVRIRADFTGADKPSGNLLGNKAGWREIGDNVVEIACSELDKVAVVRRLMTLPSGPRDIDIVPPTLDDIYAHFLEREAAE
ncbi:ABC transporter ATP-binding protein [Enhydrobacter sp.]|jgi:Cu-processing system ATP-binding protein|uniref:ABC transporter ATP-binding protein n=1 Tax=Enhydrobacter sp. TaxID=1894999 RepID=UPI00260F4BEA|nr:ABC transporter ATP-binding protein [Enhydrobacter sp.]WIM11606.1 MAG: Nitrous oxide reductase maturation protein NosF (ATPase) [Enhydrobacter sp.]